MLQCCSTAQSHKAWDCSYRSVGAEEWSVGEQIKGHHDSAVVDGSHLPRCPKTYQIKMTRPKSERRCFGALLGRVFHVQFSPSKGMLFGRLFVSAQ